MTEWNRKWIKTNSDIYFCFICTKGESFWKFQENYKWNFIATLRRFKKLFLTSSHNRRCIVSENVILQQNVLKLKVWPFWLRATTPSCSLRKESFFCMWSETKAGRKANFGSFLWHWMKSWHKNRSRNTANKNSKSFLYPREIMSYNALN